MTLRSAPVLAILSLVSAVPGAASAQADRSQVDQIPPQRARQAIEQIPRALPGAAVQPQLFNKSTGGNSQPRQITRPGAPPGVALQLSERDRNPRLAAIPPQMVDACEGAAAGGPPPPGAVDCAAVLEAVAFAARREPSAEEALLADSSEDAQRGEASRAALGRSADADVIASRLATGDVQGSPAAQAVGSASGQGAAAGAPLPQANVQIIVTGPSGTVVVTPGVGR